MSDKAEQLIARMRRTRPTGKGFERVLSDALRMLLLGEVSLKEANAVHKAAREQLRKFAAKPRKRMLTQR
jgi:hypothetical protein